MDGKESSMYTLSSRFLVIAILSVGGCDVGSSDPNAGRPTAETPHRVSAVKAHAEGPIEGYRIETSGRSRSGRFSVEIEIDREGTIRQVLVPSYPFRYGRKVTRQKFLRQFVGQRIHSVDPADVDAVTGATSSSRGVARAIQRAAALIDRNPNAR